MVNTWIKTAAQACTTRSSHARTAAEEPTTKSKKGRQTAKTKDTTHARMQEDEGIQGEGVQGTRGTR
jgi:hypothetical protein